MEMVKLMFVILLHGGISVSFVYARRRALSKAELVEITQVAEEEMVDSFHYDYQDNTEATLLSTTEPTPPPTPETQASLRERLRQIILDNDTPECNINEDSLWDLCRPIVVQTCKDEYRKLCGRRGYQMFVRRMRRHFSHPPDISFLLPPSLNEWLDEEMQELEEEMEQLAADREDDYEDSGDDDFNFGMTFHLSKSRVHRRKKVRRHRRVAPLRPYRRSKQRIRPASLHPGRDRQTATTRTSGSQSGVLPQQRMHGPREHHIPDEPRWMEEFSHHQAREPGEELICEEMERDPEICIDIVEREEKCHDEISTVCPEYSATFRLLEEELENAYPSRGLNDDEITDDEDRPVDFGETYQKQRPTVDSRPIVVEAIWISRGGKGDALVMARFYGKSPVKFRVPTSDAGSDIRSLGRAIGRKALEKHGE